MGQARARAASAARRFQSRQCRANRCTTSTRLNYDITTPEEQHCTSPLAVHCRARTTERQGSEQGWAFPTVAQSGAHAAAASLLRHRRGLCARKCGIAAPP